jgi:hypothetical protein
MEKKNLFCAASVLMAVWLTAPVQADVLSQNFESGWTVDTAWGDYTNGGWSVTAAQIHSVDLDFPVSRGTYSAWLNVVSPATTNTLRTPPLTNGVGELVYWVVSSIAGSANVFTLETSTNDAPGSYTPLDPPVTITNNSTTWSVHTNTLNLYGSFYLRWRKTSDNGNSKYLGLDDITLTHPPGTVTFLDTGTDPAIVYVDSPATIVSTVEPLGDVSGLTVTSFWKTASGSWNAVQMTNSGANVWQSSSSVPGQSFGSRIFFYVEASFSGTGTNSPMADPVEKDAAAYYFDPAVRDKKSGLDTLSVTGALATAMSLISDYTWEGVAESASPLVNSKFGFQGNDTNAAPHTWGDSTPPPGVMPLRGTAVEDEAAITIPGTNSGQFVFSFVETNLAYEVRQCVFHDFSGWTIDPYGDDSDDDWEAVNASVKTDSDRTYIGNACYLNSNGTAYIRSPYLEHGAGRISFYYRNWITNAIVTETEFYVQKSTTGGSDPSEWVTIATEENISVQEYGPYSLLINDRYYPYVRILNSTNPASRARLCIDNFMITQAGAGVVFTNAATDPLEPRVIDPVDISVDILSRANATNRNATLYYRQGGTEDFTPIGLDQSDDTFSATESIIFSGEGSTNVEYYVECSFTGYEGELANPSFYPEGGSNAPANYALNPAVSFSNLVRTPLTPSIIDTVTVRVDIATQSGVEDLTQNLWYRAGTNGTFDSTPMTLTVDTTYEGIIPRGQEGLMQFYVEAHYSGTNTPNYVSSYYPVAGKDIPLSYTNSDTTHYQDFNTWDGAPMSGFSSVESDGWWIYDAIVRGGDLDYQPNPISGDACWLDDTLATLNASIVSPELTDGAGQITFEAGNNLAGGINVFDIRTSPDLGNWTTLATFTNTSSSWTSFSCLIDAHEPVYVQIIKTGDNQNNAQYMAVENIVISYPSAKIDISEVAYTPAYPSRDVPTVISCTITSATSIFPAMSLSAQVRHREKDSGDAWSSPIGMTRGAGNVFSATIPATYGEGESVEYYIEATFGGYYGNDANNHSPTYYPAGPVVATTQYYDAPTSEFPSFTYRFYNSEYEELQVVGNFDVATMEQVGDDVWEGILTVDPTNALHMVFAGMNQRDNSLSLPTFDSWGDTNQWRSTLPVFGTLDELGGNIQMEGSFEGMYVVQVDLNTGEYIILRVDYQDFDHWFLNENLFDNGSRDRTGENTLQDFDTWTNETDDVYETGFEGLWAQYSNTWHSLSFQGGWGASEFRSVEVGGGRHRIELRDLIHQGFVRQGAAQLIKDDGVGVASVTYRATDFNTYPTLHSGNVYSNDFTIQAEIDCRATHDDKDAYVSIIYRRVSSTNYYEARLEQDGESNLIARIYKTVDGVTTIAETGTESGMTLDDMDPSFFKVKISSTDNHTVWIGASKLIDNKSVTGISGAGEFGFSAKDASLRIRSATVLTNSAIAYQEYFTNATATGWSTGGNGWNINETYDTYERVGRFVDGLQLQIGSTPIAFPNDYSQLSLGANITNITSLDYVTTNVIIHVPEESHMAIFHRNGLGTLRLDDVSVTGWRAFTNTYGPTGITWTVANTWIGGDSRVTTDMSSSTPHSLELRASRAINPTGGSQFIRTPELDTLGTAAMRYFIPDGHPDATIVLEYSTQSNRDNFQVLATNTLVATNAWKTWSLPINKNEGLKLHLRVRHASTNSDARVYIDNFEVSPYFEGDTNGWVTYNALLSQTTEPLTDDGENLVYSGGDARSGFLNYSTTNDVAGLPLTNGNPYVRSPYLPLGIGEISLWHRRWAVTNSVGEGVTLLIEMSPDATDESWQTILSTNLTNTKWQRLAIPYYDASNHYVRVSNVITPTPPDRIGMDRLTIKAPLATDLTVTNVTITPSVPLYTNAVTVHAELTDYLLSPTVTQVRAYYHLGTNQWGTWAEDQYVTLEYDEPASDPDGNPPVYAYKSTTDIPAQGIDTTVQYRVKVEFGGTLNVDKTSPKIHAQPGPNPAWYEPVNYNQSLGSSVEQNPYYIVFSCPTGAVWINEINVQDIDHGYREFIELCGPAGVSIQNWRIRLATAPNNENYGSYLIVSNTTFASETDGKGFWVLGDDHVDVLPDQIFTNSPVAQGYNMPFPQGGVQLYRSMGALVHGVSYATYGVTTGAEALETNYGYDYAGQDTYFNSTNSLSLTNTASGYYGFHWTDANGPTPGSVNTDQQFTQNGVPEEFVLVIEDLEWGSNIVLWTTYSNSLTPYVMYSTNLLDTNAWNHVTNESWEVSNDSFRIWFPLLTNAPAHFYRVTTTN